MASYTPRHAAEKILTSRSVLEGESKQAAQARLRVAPQPAQNFRPSRFSPPRSRKRPHPASAMVQDVLYWVALGDDAAARASDKSGWPIMASPPRGP